jgi:hypothetical protein
MSKKFYITEQEKLEIKKLYNLSEDSAAETFAKNIISMAQDIASKKSKGEDSNEVSSLDSKLDTKSDSSFTSSGDNWMDVTKKVIAKFEGGYWNPKCAKYPGTKHPKKEGMYIRSGETMFGLDREAGNIENVSEDGKKFFQLIDNEKQKMGMENFCNTWKWNYIPNEPLKTELTELAAKTMKKLYENNAKNYFKGKTKEIVENSKPLLLHFSYATWNGPGFFKKFAESINKGVEKGLSTSELIELAKKNRTTSISGSWAKATEKVNAVIDAEVTS